MDNLPRKAGSPVASHSVDGAEWWRVASRTVRVFGRRALARRRIAPQDVEDLQQALLLQAWQAMPRYDASRSGIRTFVELVVRTRYATCLRSCMIEHRHDWPCQNGHDVDVARQFHLRVDVGRVIAGLPSRERQLAQLLMLYRPAQAFRHLGVSHASGYRALARLRSALEDGGIG